MKKANKTKRKSWKLPPVRIEMRYHDARHPYLACVSNVRISFAHTYFCFTELLRKFHVQTLYFISSPLLLLLLLRQLYLLRHTHAGSAPRICQRRPRFLMRFPNPLRTLASPPLYIQHQLSPIYSLVSRRRSSRAPPPLAYLLPRLFNLPENAAANVERAKSFSPRVCNTTVRRRTEIGTDDALCLCKRPQAIMRSSEFTSARPVLRRRRVSVTLVSMKNARARPLLLPEVRVTVGHGLCIFLCMYCLALFGIFRINMVIGVIDISVVIVGSALFG